MRNLLNIKYSLTYKEIHNKEVSAIFEKKKKRLSLKVPEMKQV